MNSCWQKFGLVGRWISRGKRSSSVSAQERLRLYKHKGFGEKRQRRVVAKPAEVTYEIANSIPALYFEANLRDTILCCEIEFFHPTFLLSLSSLKDDGVLCISLLEM